MTVKESSRLPEQRANRKPGRTYRRYSLALVLVIIGSMLLLSIAAQRMETQYGLRVDFSFNGITTQSEETEEVLRQLPSPVHIYALFRRGEEDVQLLELLNRYQAATPLVTWEQADPSLNPSLLARYATESETVEADSLIVVGEETGRFRVLGPEDYVSLSMDTETGEYTYAGWTYERGLTSAIAYVTRERIPRVVVAQGHGELDGETLASFTEWLEANQYEVAWLNLREETPEVEDLLLCLSPLRDFSDAELEKLRSFAGQGGSFLFTCDSSDPVADMQNWQALLRSYGFLPLEGIVVAGRDAVDTYYNNTRIHLIPEMLSTDITMDLLASGADTLLLPGTRAFETPQETDRNLLVSPVLQSGEGSYRKVLRADTTTMDQTEEDPTGPFTLALQARRITENGFVSRAFVLGCSAVLTEPQIWSMTDTRQFLLQVFSFLLDTEASTLNISPKDALRPALGVGSTGLGSVVLVLLPLMVLAAALIVLIPRRNR